MQISNEDLIVVHKGIPKAKLNLQLMINQHATHNLEDIKACHVTKLDIYDAINETNDLTKLKLYAEDLMLCEFELQKLWNFPEDIKFHRFWDTPKCKCPKIDNSDNYPTGYYSIVRNCPLHGA